VISALALTPEHAGGAELTPQVSRLGFTFFASAATRVHVSLRQACRHPPPRTLAQAAPQRHDQREEGATRALGDRPARRRRLSADAARRMVPRAC
jgi:hypothetical protein